MKEKIIKFLCMFTLLFVFSTNVLADSILNAGDSLVDQGTYDSTRFVAGNNVTSESTVNGISFIAGNQTIFEGKSEYGFLAGNMVTISGTIDKDLFVAGNSIIIDNTAEIGRDVYVAGNTVLVESNIARDLRIGASHVDLSGITINGDAYIYANDITMDKETVIIGTLTYEEDAVIDGLDLATIGNIKKTSVSKVNVKINYMSNIYDFIISTCATFISLVVLFYLLPKTNDLLNNLKLEAGSVAKNIGFGLVFLFVFPIVAIIALFTGFLTPVALIGLCIYAICIYIAIIITYYIVGINLIKKLFNKDNKYLAMIVGILLVKVVKLIPVVGGFIETLLLFYGMGLIFNYLKSETR